jgi:P-type E1-E2 ATPase
VRFEIQTDLGQKEAAEDIHQQLGITVIELNIPGRGVIRIEHLVSDVNGTLAVDGQLIPGIARTLSTLQDRLAVHLLTADTQGRQDNIDRQLGLRAVRIPPGAEAAAKAEYIQRLGPASVVAIGQGANDAEMLREAAIGICIQSKEGLAVESLMAADILSTDILSALDLLDNPLRRVASLRR